MRKTSRLDALRKQIETLTFDMQKFCLNPSLEKFTAICKCDSLRRKEGEDFDIWRTACLYKYGGDWGLAADPENEKKTIQNVEFVFSMQRENLCKKAIELPSQSSAIKLLHIFFALGELEYIELFYQCMGHERLPISTRRYLVDVYRNTREMYREEVPKLLKKNPNHFTDLELAVSTVDFSYFDDAKERALEEKRKNEEKSQFLGDAVRKTVGEPSAEELIFLSKFGK